jgi:hypothetical protein
LERLRIPVASIVLLALVLALAGCGGKDPDPEQVLDRALTRENLAEFGRDPSGPAGGVVEVQALGYEDRVLQEQRVEANPSVMTRIRDALGSDSGLRGLLDDLEYEGEADLSGTGTDHVSGQLEVAGLARALDDAGGGGVSQLAGVDRDIDLEKSLVSAGFDLYAGQEDSVIRRLDLTLAIDDPGNALPPTRIRFSLTPDSSGVDVQ